MALRSLYALARRNGYKDGEHCLGAACFFSVQALRAMQAKGLFGNPALVTTNLGDDHMYGLLVRAAGFETDDFATEGRPLGLAFRGLPLSPMELVEGGKKIVHSLKDHGGRTSSGPERRVRAPGPAAGRAPKRKRLNNLGARGAAGLASRRDESSGPAIVLATSIGLGVEGAERV